MSVVSEALLLLSLVLCASLCLLCGSLWFQSARHGPVTACYGAVTSPPYPGNTRLLG